MASCGTFSGTDVPAEADTPPNAEIRLTKAGVADAPAVAMIDAGLDEVVERAHLSAVQATSTVIVHDSPAPEATSSGKARDAGPFPVPTAPGNLFRDRLSGGGEGPGMVVVPAGRFRMGCLSDDSACSDNEKPVHEVVIPAPFALSVHEVTFEHYDRFTYPYQVDDEDWGRGRRPVINVSWPEAQGYAEWLSAQTGQSYRLPSEAEWEYAARAGTTTGWYHGDEEAELCRYANHSDRSADHDRRNETCSDGFGGQTAPAGWYAPNGFGLYDMHGNVWEWVADCWNRYYAGAPTDGSAWIHGNCNLRVVRGGSFFSGPSLVRAASRDGVVSGGRHELIGFRVARTLTP